MEDRDRKAGGISTDRSYRQKQRAGDLRISALYHGLGRVKSLLSKMARNVHNRLTKPYQS